MVIDSTVEETSEQKKLRLEQRQLERLEDSIARAEKSINPGEITQDTTFMDPREMVTVARHVVEYTERTKNLNQLRRYQKVLRSAVRQDYARKDIFDLGEVGHYTAGQLKQARLNHADLYKRVKSA